MRVAEGHSRLVAALVEIDGVYLFADVGWSDGLGRHPFHVLPEGALLEEVQDGDPLAFQWNEWLGSSEALRRMHAEEFLRTFWRIEIQNM